MIRLKPLPLLLGVFLIIPFSCPSFSSDENAVPDSLASLTPEDAYLYMSIPSLERTFDAFKTLPLYKAYQDEEVQAFLESLEAGMDEMFPGLSRDVMKDLLSLPEIFDGEIAFALLPPPSKEEEPDWILSLGSLKDPGKGSAFAEKTLVPFLEGMFPWRLDDLEIKDATVKLFSGPKHTLCVVDLGGRILVSSTGERIVQILESAAEGKGTLAQNPTYLRAKARMLDEKTGFFFYLPLENIWKPTLKEMDASDKQVFYALGFEGLRSLSAHLTMEGGRAEEVIWLDIPDERKGLLKIFSNARVYKELAGMAPDNTLLLAAGTFSLPDLYQVLITASEASSDKFVRNFRNQMGVISKELGLRSMADLVGQLGTEVVLFAALPKGGGILPEVAAAIEVLEPDKLQNNLFALVRTLTGSDPKSVAYRDRQLYYLPRERRDLGDLFELGFCWCVTDGYLILSHHPTILKGITRRLDKAAGSLQDDPEFTASWSRLPEKATAVAYVNSKRLFDYIYNVFLFFANMAGDDLPFDTAMLPSAEAISSYLSFGLSGVTVEKEGIFVRTESDGYGPTSMVLYGLSVAFFAIPIEGWSESVKDYPSCGNAQETIYEALEIYRSEHQHYPDSLRVLIDDERLPRWSSYCNKAWMERDRTNIEDAALEDFEYILAVKKLEAPTSFPEDWMILWDSDPRHNSGRVILLGNGDVTWLPEPVFQKRLEEQGK